MSYPWEVQPPRQGSWIWMLRRMSQLAIAMVLALGLISLALLTIQNVTPVALSFLTLQSIEMPVGLLLVFAVAGGLVVGSLLVPLSGGSRRRGIPSQQQLDREFDFDDLV
ncbi:LapA family protein [Synechocystis sp. LEGE 06083]|uniref:LapA family protein n=1 Tax=Synechocystis sp. LEGE 06083 TaxID=915336 RepID=UPI00187FC7C7|nr:LapA family protein [Synechocystis sp. LEGE 06083]MBE9195061.1 LapA family protein [Synechocystis sp. LEGE 06083]